ncbi:MAG TPA: hypothetical protein PKW55_02310 [Spirochaetota bacterium]|nr:hypothetical protein [Spirochaetota bacterium]HOM38319.1 hypothetical protein [Spirochaetota bacterium]HPQ48463.1 hypothetical protein [Spirochaetota bacterium]
MKNTIKLAIIFFIILGIVIILPSKKEKEDKNDFKTEQLISLPEPMLEKLIVYTKEGKIELVKENEKYKIVSTEYIAGPQEFSLFLGDINSIEGYKIKEIKQIKEEKIFIEAYLKNNIKKYVSIVGKSEFGKDSYFLKTEKGFYQIESEKINKVLDYTIKKLRNHAITDFISDDIKEFWIDNINFYKDQSNKWLIKDYKEEIDENKVFGAFAMATGLRAKEFTCSKNLKEYNLDKPNHKLVIYKSDDNKIVIIFSKKNNNYYGYSDTVKEIFEIYKTDWDILEKNKDYYKKEKEDKKEVKDNEK